MPEPRLQELASSLDALAARGLRIAFLPFQQHDTEDDDTMHRAIAARMRQRDAGRLPAMDGGRGARRHDLPRGVAGGGDAAARGRPGRGVRRADGDSRLRPQAARIRAAARRRRRRRVDLDRPDACRARFEDALGGSRSGAGEPPPHDWMRIAFQA
jgi:hypothetical protein